MHHYRQKISLKFKHLILDCAYSWKSAVSMIEAISVSKMEVYIHKEKNAEVIHFALGILNFCSSLN